MTVEKDLESGSGGGGGKGCCLDPELMKKGVQQALSPAFLSSGLQVTFKARRGPGRPRLGRFLPPAVVPLARAGLS